MKAFYRSIVNHPVVIITIFLILAVVFGLMKGFVGVNYDMKDYLPADAPSTVSLELMKSEFDGDIPNARVMVRNVTIPQALEYKEKLLACDGVDSVTWLDDAADIYKPLSEIDTGTLETYYKDNDALYVITIAGDRKTEAVEALREVIGDENAMTGAAVSTVVSTASTVDEINIITVCAVAFVILVLLLTTASWFEPVIVLIGLGVAIIINAGSNIIFGEVSFVTNAAGMILQLAVSLDYSVFLMHRFEECKQSEPDVKTAMVNALSASTGSILSSGLTTVIGFAALIFMRFGIGPDLGLALAKGVAISLITVFFFMPPLIVALNGILEKTRHKPFMPSFRGFGRFICRIMIPAACVFALIIAPAFLASDSNAFYYGSAHIFGSETQLGADTAAIEEVFGKSDTYVLIVPRGDTATEKELSDALHEIPQVKSIISYVDTVGAEIPTSYLDSETLSKLMSDNYSRMVVTVSADYEGDETFALVEKIRAAADTYYPGTSYLAGEGVSTYDLMDTITADTLKVNLIAIGAVFVILLLMMKSVTLPVILVLCIETAIWLNLAVPYFSDSTVFYIAYLIISSVQLGATVDYAILFTDRYREYRRSMDKKAAVIETVSSCTVSIITSASAMATVGLLLGYISTHGILSQLGIFIGRGALLSLAVVLLVLPGLLYIFDRLVCRDKHKKEKKSI